MRLLHAAAEIAGGMKLLAERLDSDELLLASYLGDRRRLPDRLLLKAVDIILEDRTSRVSPVGKLPTTAWRLQR